MELAGWEVQQNDTPDRGNAVTSIIIIVAELYVMLFLESVTMSQMSWHLQHRYALSLLLYLSSNCNLGVKRGFIMIKISV